MRIPVAALALCLLCSLPVTAGESGTRRMSGWFNVTTPDGWTGKRYMDGDEIFAEEFDSNGDARIDVWRFYRRGLLTSEERALGGHGRVNYQSRWDPRRRLLISVFRDTNWTGVNDLEIEYTGRSRWEVREDRNQDGVADRILLIHGPPDLFEFLGMDLSQQTDVIDNIPMEYWYELQSDDYYTCAITDYRRYNKGLMTHYGQWDGQRVVWQRAGPDYVPPAAPAPVVQPGPAVAAGVDPWQTDQTGTDAFLPSGPGDPFADPFATHGDPNVVLGPPGDFRPPTDRTRYDGLPPGDSAARSLPARMRPPGVGPR